MMCSSPFVGANRFKFKGYRSLLRLSSQPARAPLLSELFLFHRKNSNKMAEPLFFRRFFFTMQRPSAPTMPSTTRTSIIMSLRSSSGTAGASSPCISVIGLPLSQKEPRCTTTRSIFSSTTPLPESKGSCRSSTYIGCEKFPFHNSFSLSTSGVL